MCYFYLLNRGISILVFLIYFLYSLLSHRFLFQLFSNNGIQETNKRRMMINNGLIRAIILLVFKSDGKAAI